MPANAAFAAANALSVFTPRARVSKITEEAAFTALPPGEDIATGMLAADIIDDAIALIAQPEQWTTGSYARDAAGKPTDPENQEAVQYCAIGALECAASKRDELYGKAMDIAIHSCQSTAAVYGFAGISYLNDAGDHATVLDMLKRTAAGLRASNASPEPPRGKMAPTVPVDR